MATNKKKDITTEGNLESIAPDLPEQLENESGEHYRLFLMYLEAKLDNIGLNLKEFSEQILAKGHIFSHHNVRKISADNQWPDRKDQYFAQLKRLEFSRFFANQQQKEDREIQQQEEMDREIHSCNVSGIKLLRKLFKELEETEITTTAKDRTRELATIVRIIFDGSRAVSVFQEISGARLLKDAKALSEKLASDQRKKENIIPLPLAKAEDRANTAIAAD